MKRTYSRIAFALCAALMVFTAGCSSTGKTAASASAAATTASAATASPAGEETTEAAEEPTAATEAAASVSADQGTDSTAESSASPLMQISSSGLIDTTDLFSNRDLTQTADTSDATQYTVTDGADVSITEEGVYVISGTASDCTIRVEAPDDAKVQLVLDGVSITNTDAPAIYVVSADKCFVTTTDSSSTLETTGTFAADGETNTDAVIFSKTDLVLNGTGTLNITSAAGNGITSKDDLKITGGSYALQTAKDGIEANDSISICDGTFTIQTDKDGLHCENSDDNTLGSICILGGTFDITAGDDGIQGTTITEIDGGELTIQSAEGIEGTYVQINGGTISISASDDGINAAAKSTAFDVVIELNGGSITIVMGSGDTDAVDANGSIYVTGGTIDITAGSSFDYDVSGEISGGTVTVNGAQITEMPAPMMGGGKRG